MKYSNYSKYKTLQPRKAHVIKRCFLVCGNSLTHYMNYTVKKNLLLLHKLPFNII
jgi:hypothetical protein